MPAYREQVERFLILGHLDDPLHIPVAEGPNHHYSQIAGNGLESHILCRVTSFHVDVADAAFAIFSRGSGIDRGKHDNRRRIANA